jgi:4-amino-4-deoxy-L-arabinose transferase-like glycosyltransferase
MTMIDFMKKTKWIWFLLIIAAVLRFYAIRFGEPYRYHPDEIKLLTTAGRLLDTHFASPEVYFVYGTYPVLYTFILSFLIGVYVLIMILTGRFESLQYAKVIYEQNPFTYLILGRYFVALLGICSVILLTCIVSRLYSKKIGLISGLLLAVNFVHAINSHFSTVDVPATFFGLCAFYFIVRLADEPVMKFYIYSAVFIALAVAAKFNLLFLIIPLLYVHLTRPGNATFFSWHQLNQKILAAIVCGIVIFLIACPLFLIDFGKAWHGLIHTKNFETNGKLGSGGGFLSYWTGNQAPGFGAFYPNSIPTTFGWVLMILVILGLFLLVKRHRRSDLMMLAFVIPTYAMFEFMTYRAMRHLLPVIPFLVTFAAIAIVWLSETISKKAIIQKGLLAVILIFLTGAGFFRISHYLYYLKQPDPRTDALEWIKKNVTPGTPVAVESFPPFLPGQYEQNRGDVGNYKIFELKLTSRDNNLFPALVDSMKQLHISYYISDGFTRQTFDWKQTRQRYPAVVQDRRLFFEWLDAHTDVAACFKPLNPFIQPQIVIYRLRNNSENTF